MGKRPAVDQENEKGDDEVGPNDSDPNVSTNQRKEAGVGPTPPSAVMIHEIIREEGEEELERSSKAIIWSALGAGLSMGFSFLVMGFIKSGLPEAHWTKLVSGFGYTIGFLIVVLGRQQLFTESTLTAVLPLLTRRDATTLWLTSRLWALVLVFNILGTFVFAWLISREGLFDDEVVRALHTLSAEALKDTFVPMMVKAILAGWLIALMVWLIPGAGQARLWLIVILTYVVAIAHFSHIIAGSVEAAYAVFDGHITVAQYFPRFLIPTLIGNTIGGVSLVAVFNHAPVREELPGEQNEPRA